MTRVSTFILVATLALGVVAAQAQDLGPAPGERVGTAVPPAGQMPELLQEVGLDQKLNTQVPLGLKFKDEDGRVVTLGDYFGKRPVILTLNYFECPMLCTEVLNGLVSALGVMNFSVGKEFDVVTVSFDPRDTPERARQKKAAYLGRYKRPGSESGWHFLTGSDHEIAALTRAVGFRYAYNAKAGQFAHASGVMVATPEGRLSHYFYGIEYGPRDLRLALVEASDHKIGSAVDQVLLACFHYDPSSGRYSMAVMTAVRAAGLAMVGLIAGAIVLMRRRERRGPLSRNAHA
jgi:protein SCO1/2